MTDLFTTFKPGLREGHQPGTVNLSDTTAAALSLLSNPQTLTVIVNDPQRATATSNVLQILANQIDPKNIRILVATGSHKTAPHRREAFETTLAGSIDFQQIAWHDADSRDLVPIGDLWRGHPWLRDNAPLLAIGSVEPHYFAGFTGAHKTLTIGVASHEDIQSNHAAAISSNCQPGRLEGNPVYEGVAEMLSSLAAEKSIAAINLVQAGANIIFASAGEPIESLLRCVPIVQAIAMRRIDSPADCIIAEVTGPLGESFYQADKGIKNNEHALRDGGVLVLVAPCPSGLGQDAFAQLLRESPTFAQAIETVKLRGYRLGDHKAVRLRHLTDTAGRNVKLVIVSDGISAAQAALLGANKTATVDEAFAATGIDPDGDKVYRLLDAGNCCLIVDS